MAAPAHLPPSSPATTQRWSLPVSAVAIAVGLPALFWIQFGVVDGFALGFTAFLELLVLAVHFIPRRAEVVAGAGGLPPVARHRLDVLGVGWLLAVPFGPLLGWVLTSAFALTPGNWRLLLGARAAVCVLVPLVCVLPLVRFVRGSARAFMASVLVLGTAFPVVCGFDAAVDTVLGPRWESVAIVRLRDFDFQTPRGTRVHVSNAYAELADGRTLRNAGAVRLQLGPAELLTLHASDVIIGVR